MNSATTAILAGVQRCLDPRCTKALRPGVTKLPTYCQGSTCRTRAERARSTLKTALAELLNMSSLSDAELELKEAITFRLRELMLLSAADVEAWVMGQLDADEPIRRRTPKKAQA